MNFYLIQFIFYYLTNYCTSIHNFQFSPSPAHFNPTDDFKPIFRVKRGFGDFIDSARQKAREGLRKTAELSVSSGKKLNNAACKFWDSADRAFSKNYQGDLPCAGQESGSPTTGENSEISESPDTSGFNPNNTDPNSSNYYESSISSPSNSDYNSNTNGPLDNSSNNFSNNNYNPDTNGRDSNAGFLDSNPNANRSNSETNVIGSNRPNINNNTNPDLPNPNDPNYYTEPSPVNPGLNRKESKVPFSSSTPSSLFSTLNPKHHSVRPRFPTTPSLMPDSSISSNLFYSTLPSSLKNCRCTCPSTSEYEIIESETESEVTSPGNSRIRFRLVKKNSPVVFIKRTQINK